MSLRNPNRQPTHPGAILREDVLPALGMTQTEFAKRLLVSRLTVSELLHEKRGLSPDLAARIGKLTRTTHGIVAADAVGGRPVDHRPASRAAGGHQAAGSGGIKVLPISFS